MTSPESHKAWDFTPVFDLLNSFKPDQNVSYENSGLAAAAKHNRGGGKDGDVEKDDDRQDNGVTLGNFKDLWTLLGVPSTQNRTYTSAFDTSIVATDAYASDGAIYYPPSSKAVKWRDEEEGQDLAETQPDSPPSPSQGLTKNQRKKRNRKLRKAEAAKADPSGKVNTVVSSESEDDFGRADDTKDLSKVGTNGATQAVNQAKGLTTKLIDNASDRERASNKKGDSLKSQLSKTPEAQTPPSTSMQSSKKRQDQVQETVSKPAAKHGPAATQPRPMPQRAQSHAVKANSNGVADAIFNATNVQASPQTPPRSVLNTIHQSLQKQNHGQSNVPAHLQHSSTPTPASLTLSPYQQYQQRQTLRPPTQNADISSFPVISTKPTSRHRHEILPLDTRSTDDRNWSLLLKLIHNFPQDRKHLLSPLQLSINRPQVNGIHVFVDASNILIGFQEHLRRARGISQHTKIGNTYPSFHALALLLERRRPVTKRVLAGSTPEVPAFEEARQVGYETCILDKVWKAKELTEKQKRIMARQASGRHYSSTGYSSGAADVSDGYTSEDAVQQVAKQKPRWVEQAVDEILHLKILESIVDFQPPEKDDSIGDAVAASARPTMVLATGDAAVAEYSSGFLKMVERALKQGWNVEVMAWGDTVSYDYKKLQGRSKWKDQFKIIPLDEYAEELFSIPEEN